MDPLTSLLRTPRATDAFVLRCLLDPPWSIRIEDRAPLALLAVTAGEAWLVPDGEAARRLGPGTVALLRGPEPYLLADEPTRQPQVVVEPGQVCRSISGQPMAEAMSLGVRTWGTSATGTTTMLVGTYDRPGSAGDRLLATLPRTAVLPADRWDCPLVAVLATELERDEPGQPAVIDRLLDLVLVSAIRAWLAQDREPTSSWFRAGADPVVGHALRLLHNNVAHRWTVAGLAAQVGVSRALLARRFTDLIGTPPMTYLSDLRLSLAADRLLEPGLTIGAVAAEVGYGSAFALSAAFRRVRGMSPTQHRAAIGRDAA
ncbi:MAG: AraC family transcriptional regulator [Acidimicrobiales bacterium]